MKRYEVEVFIDGKPTYMVDVPAGDEGRAERSARVWIMTQHPRMSMDRITSKATGNFEELA